MSSQAVADMTRDELEREVDELRDRLEELEERVEKTESNYATETVLNQLIAKLTGAEMDMTADPFRNMDVIEDLGSRIQDMESTLQRHETVVSEAESIATDKQGSHWQSAVAFAQKNRDKMDYSLPDNWVILYKEDIANATGLSKKRASQLIDEWTEEASDKQKSGARKQDWKPQTAGNKSNAQKKALKIDLDVWGEANV